MQKEEKRRLCLSFQGESFLLIQKETYFLRISAPSSGSFQLRTQKFLFLSYMMANNIRNEAKYKGTL